MIRKLEELSLNAWPALQTMLYDGWVLRWADGYSKRANSVNPLYSSSEEIESKIAVCEAFYHSRALDVVYKITPCSQPADLDAVLEQKGYATCDHTSLQWLELTNLPEPKLHSVQVENRVSEEWLDPFCRFSNKTERDKQTMKNMLSSIPAKTCFLSLKKAEEVVACGLGVLEGNYMGIFDIVTDTNYRKQGLGEQLMLNLLHWGKSEGATYAYLQVVQTNQPALHLYEKLGFQEQYTYWYRVKSQENV